MFEKIFLVTFTTFLIIANIYCFKNKKYLYLFIPCMLFLPSYYGIELSSGIPLITVTRLMYVVFYIYAYTNRRRCINFHLVNVKNLPKEYMLLFGYFFFRIISNLRYITIYAQASKTIFFLIFEQLLLLVAVYILAPKEEEIHILVKVIVGCATVLFVIGIFESYTSICIFDSLYTVQRNMLNDHYIRLGLLRAKTTLGLPGFFGNMGIYILPLIFYLYQIEHSRIYLLITGVDILAIIHSGARSSVFYLIIVFGIYFIYVLKGKKRRVIFVKNMLIIFCSLCMFIYLVSLNNINLKYYYSGSIKSILNEVGFEFDLNEGAPEGVNGYGTNANGTLSRTKQFSGIIYTAHVNPIFGLGSGAQNRREIKYFSNIGWLPSSTYDLGIVEIFGDEGALGLLGVCLIIFYMILSARRNRLYQLAVVAYLLSTLSTINIYMYLMLYIILFDNRMHGEYSDVL